MKIMTENGTAEWSTPPPSIQPRRDRDRQRDQRRVDVRRLGVDVRAIQTPLSIFYMKNH